MKRSKGEGERPCQRRDGRHKMRSKVLGRGIKERCRPARRREEEEQIRGKREQGDWTEPGKEPQWVGFGNSMGSGQVRLPSSSGFLLDRIW